MIALTWLEICGFRSFAEPQRFDFDGVLSVVDGANSQGKTSTAEAIEFLLTGTTVRRRLLGGAKAEFAECLRNAHIPANSPVWVRAGLVGVDGLEHEVERILEMDYTAEDDCQSRLTADGAVVDDLSSIGIRLADPPLRAPVLLQHSLRFALSARPQDRADYFKSVLELQDLEVLRDLISDQPAQLRPPTSTTISRLQSLAAVTELNAALGQLEAAAIGRAALQRKLADALDVALVSVGASSSDATLPEKVANLNAALESAREGDFPVSSYGLGAPPAAIADRDFTATRAYNGAITAIDAETERLRTLFQDVLALPAVAAAGDVALDCPICETPAALTPERIRALREKVAAESGLHTSRSRAEAELAAIATELAPIRSAVDRSVPSAAKLAPAELAEHQGLADQLVGGADAHAGTVAHLAPLNDTASAARQAIDALRSELQLANTRLAEATAIDVDALIEKLASAAEPLARLVSARDVYATKSSALLEAIRVEVDRRRGTERWRQLVELASTADALYEALLDQRAYARVKRELERAAAEIDKAKAKVFDEKFKAMSGEIETWWHLLRPDEPARFASVRRRGTGRRYVSFKAHLYPAVGAPAVERDALGVFSDSQLNALSLAAFLARCRLQNAPFVILDDPLQAGDDEHRPTFVAYVLGKLIEDDVQVIVLTHDDRTSKQIHHLHERLPVVGFALSLEKPFEGTTVTRTTNTAEALLQRAKVYLDSDDAQLRGSAAAKLREAAERIAKEIIVKSRNATGDSCSLAEYDGVTLGPLIRQITPYLTQADHPGKWTVIGDWLNPGTHDDTPPAKNELKMAFGYLREFVKVYLRGSPVSVAT